MFFTEPKKLLGMILVMGYMFYYIDQSRIPAFCIGSVKTESEALDQLRLIMERNLVVRCGLF